jgi:hypothetical protein
MKKTVKDFMKEIEGLVKVCDSFYEFERKSNEIKREVYERETYLNNIMLEISKPVLKDNHTSKDVDEYLILLKEYEKKSENFSKEFDELTKVTEFINDTLKIEAEHFACLDSIVPIKYQSKVKSLAWERGHSSGYSEYYIQLLSLVEIFEEDND